MSYYQELGFIPGVVPALLAPLLFTKVATAAMGPSEEECRQNRDRATASIDAATDEAARNWRPTGFYRTADMAKMRDQVVKMLADAAKACEDAAAGNFTYKTTLRMAQSKVQNQLADSLVFTNAIGTAQQRGIAVIDSPSFKRWVIDSMNTTSVAIGHVAYMACLKPALVSIVEKVYQFSRGIITIAKTMVKVAIAAGEQFLKIPDTLGTLWKWTKWGSLAALAAYALYPKKRANPCGRRRR